MNRQQALNQLRIMQAWHEDNGNGPNADYDAICYAINIIEEMPEIIRCNDCKHNPKLSWFDCPMSHLSEAQRPETAWCWKAERRTDG